jgi:anti-sigma-K factor RskA
MDDQIRDNAPRPNRNCDTLRELLPAYAMGITDPDETALVEQLLGECPDEAAELAHYRSMAAALPMSVEQKAPPAALHDMLMARVAVETPAPAPALPRPQRPQQPLRLPTGTTRWLWAAAAALLLVFVGGIVFMSMQLSDVREERNALADQLESSRELLSLLGGGDAVSFDLVATDSSPERNAAGTVLCNPNRSVGLVHTANLPALPADMVYQVWLIRDGERISAGVFNVSADGTGALLVTAPEVFANYQWLGITAEPAPGSEGPTSDPLVGGPLYSNSS